NDIEIIAAHDAGRAPGDGKLDAFEDGHVTRQQALLNLFGSRQFSVLRGFQTLLAAARAACGYVIAQHSKQPRVLPRLLNAVGGAATHRLDRQLDIGPGGHRHDWQSAVERPNPRDQIKSLLPRRRIARVIEVYQNQVEIARSDRFERFGWRSSGL